ncbi:uncharacterized protein [Mytilus edulis]
MFMWSKIKGTAVRWPVKVVRPRVDDEKCIIYIHSDHAEVAVDLKSCIPFYNENYDKMMQEGIDILKKKKMKDTLAEFLEDCRWVLKEYSACTEKAPGKGKRKRKLSRIKIKEQKKKKLDEGDQESADGLSGIKGDCSSVNSELENTEIVGNDDEMVEQILQNNTKLIKKDHESADGLSGIKGDCSSVNSELENTEIVGNDDEMVEQILQDNTKLIKKDHESADGLSGIKGDCSSVNSELENTEIVGNDDEMVEQILQDNTKLIKKDHESAHGLSGIKGDCSSVNSELQNTEIVGNDDEMVEQILQDNTKLIKKDHESAHGLSGIKGDCSSVNSELENTEIVGNDDEMVEQILQDNTKLIKKDHESADGLSGIKGDCSSVNSELENTEIVGNDDEMVEQILQDNTKLIKKDHESADGLSGIKGDCSSVNSELENTEIVGNDDEMVEQILQDNTKLIKKDHESADGLSGIKGDCSSVNSELENTEIVGNDDEMVEQILQDNTKLIKKDHESEDGLSGIKGDCSSVNSEIKNTEIVVNDVSDDDQIKDPDYMPWEEESIPDSENEWEDLDTIMKYLPELSFQALDSLDDEHLEGIVLENSKDFINQTDVLENSFDIVDQIDELKKENNDATTVDEHFDENMNNLSDNEETLEEFDGDKLFADDKPHIYVRKVMKSLEKKSNQPRKKGDRVYNSYHACLFCNRLVQHIQIHVKAKHAKEIKNLSKNYVRVHGDHRHNLKVVSDEKGEMLLSRRPVKSFNVSDYGPCPDCFEWMLKNTLGRHQSKCKDKEKKKQSKKSVILESNILSGQLNVAQVSKLMLKEVFPTMTVDVTSKIAQKDPIILGLGESWLRRSYDNILKRKNTASGRMRLCSRYLQILRSNKDSIIINDTEKQSEKPNAQTSETDMEIPMWEFLKPEYFEKLASAALEVAMPLLDDEEELKSPSNAIKLKYDLVRMVNIKWAYLVKNSGSKEEKKTCKELLQLITVEWSEKVTKIARSVLTTRKLTHEREIPAPEDIRKINEYIINQLEKTELQASADTYRLVATLTETRLLMYNKRRSGEIDSIRLKDYAIRRTDLNDVDESLIGDLTDLENELLRSQDLMVVRGKRSRPVPVIISNELKKPLEYLANPEIRKMFIKPSNKFLFPSTGDGPLRSYDSMKNVCEKLNLKRPESITSVTLRKYTATLSQVLSLKENEIGWLCKHLGHTKSVHTEHYKQLSGYVERVEIGKLMMIQDMNLVSKFKGKDLHSVNFTDILKTDNHNIEEKQQDVYDINNDADDIDVDETVIHKEKLLKENLKKTTRVKWTTEEEEEIKKYFGNHLKVKTTPGKSECLKIIQKSRENGGQICRRDYHTIVKKISNMNKK